jgi:hypothetical protein
VDEWDGRELLEPEGLAVSVFEGRELIVTEELAVGVRVGRELLEGMALSDWP